MTSIKDIAAAVGYDVEDESKFDLASFKAHVSKSYTPVDKDGFITDEKIKKSFLGKINGSLRSKIAQEFEFKHSDLEDKTAEDALLLIKQKYTGIISDLEAKSGKGNDEKLTAAEQKIKDQETALLLKDKSLTEWETKYTTDIKGSEAKLKTYKLNEKIGKVKTALSDKFTDDYKKPLIKTGFDSTIASKYHFDLEGDDENVVIRDSKTKEIVTTTKGKVGDPATLEEVFTIEADAAGILKKNNAPVKSVPATKVANTNNMNQDEVFVHPNALRNAQRQVPVKQ